MTRIFIFTLLLLIYAGIASAQNLIARQNGGTPHFHTELDDAVTQAVNGDTLYLPGGLYVLNVPVTKELHLVGEGHYPELSRVNGTTIFNCGINLKPGCDNSSFHGLTIHGTIMANDDTLKNITFMRCNLSDFSYSSSVEGSSAAWEYCRFIENVYRGYNNGTYKNCSFYNNILQGFFYGNPHNCMFRNNIFLVENRYSPYPFHHDLNGFAIGSFNRFEYNVILTSSYIFDGIGNSFFYNNLFVGSPTFDQSSNVGSNNLIEQPFESIFENVTERAFRYNYDFHLKSNYSQEIGIYGGPSPWKNGIPFNPHIEFKNVAGYTNADGTLNVQVKVTAQDR